MPYRNFLCNRPPYWVGSVWKKYSNRIYKLCLQKCRTRDDADDLFQEVALRFCKKARELNNKNGFYGWFQTVLLNCHYSFHRKDTDRMVPFSCLQEKVFKYDHTDPQMLVIPDNKPKPEVFMNEFSQLLDVLEPLERMIVELSVVGGLSVRDLKELIGLSKASIVERRNLAIEKMKEKMMAQKENYRSFWERNASLNEIIGNGK